MQERRSQDETQITPGCKYCGFDTHKDIIKAAIWTNNGLIVIEDIPARLCGGCGEQFFDEKVTQKIAEVTKYPAAKAKQKVRVPVCSLSQDQAAEKQSKPEKPDKQHTAFTYYQKKQVIESAGINENHQGSLLCKYCKSETVEDVIKSVFWLDGEPIVLENIPARVCQRCGQQFYDVETAERITALKKSRCGAAMVSKSILVPVFSLTDVRCLQDSQSNKLKKFSRHS